MTPDELTTVTTSCSNGKLFVAPLLYMHDGPNVIVVASQGGRPENSQWYRNLVANPDPHRDRR